MIISRSSLKDSDNTTTISDSGFRPVDPPPTATATLTATANTVNESLKVETINFVVYSLKTMFFFYGLI